METRSRTRGRMEEGFMICGNITDERVWRVEMEAFVVFMGMDSRWHCEAAFQGVVEVLLDDFVRFRSVDDCGLYVF